MAYIIIISSSNHEVAITMIQVTTSIRQIILLPRQRQQRQRPLLTSKVHLFWPIILPLTPAIATKIRYKKGQIIDTVKINKVRMDGRFWAAFYILTKFIRYIANGTRSAASNVIYGASPQHNPYYQHDNAYNNHNMTSPIPSSNSNDIMYKPATTTAASSSSTSPSLQSTNTTLVVAKTMSKPFW